MCLDGRGMLNCLGEIPCSLIAWGYIFEFLIASWSIGEEGVLLVAATGFEPVAKGL